MFDLSSTGRNTWLIDESRIGAMQQQLSRLRAFPSPQQMEEARQLASAKLRQVKGKIAVMPVQGMIEQRMSTMGYYFGSFPLERAEELLDHYANDASVEAIVLDVDSPGGTSYGVEEFSNKLYETRGKKKLYAVANSLAASAAYWIASGASLLYATPGGDVGSIGVYAIHVDESKFLENEGVKVTIVKAGKFKAEGNPYEPLTAEGRDHLQESVDETYLKFIKGVARNRGATADTVRKSYGQGRVLSAEKALAAGMIDGILTFSQVLEKLGGDVAPMSRRGASMEVMRARHEQEKARAN